MHRHVLVSHLALNCDIVILQVEEPTISFISLKLRYILNNLYLTLNFQNILSRAAGITATRLRLTICNIQFLDIFQHFCQRLKENSDICNFAKISYFYPFGANFYIIPFIELCFLYQLLTETYVSCK